MKETKSDVYTRITNRIVADLEQGVRPWHRPWNADHAAGKITRPLRYNSIPYKGINVIMLWSAATVSGYACPASPTEPEGSDGRAPAKGGAKLYALRFPSRKWRLGPRG